MPYASSIQVINDANGTAYAFLADNGAIWQCQWNAQAQLWDQGVQVPGATGGVKLQALYLNDLWPGATQGSLSSGSSPGIVLAYRVGEGSGAEIFASLGRWGSAGVLQWSEPQQLTADQVDDQAFSLVPTNKDGGFSLVVQKQQAGLSSNALLDRLSGSEPKKLESELAAAASSQRPDADLYVNQYSITQTGTKNPSWTLTSPTVTSKNPPPPITWEPQEATSAPSPISLTGNTQLSRQALYSTDSVLNSTATTSSGGVADTNSAPQLGASSTSSGSSNTFSWKTGGQGQYTTKSGGALRYGPLIGQDPQRWQLGFPAVVDIPKNYIPRTSEVNQGFPPARDSEVEFISESAKKLLNPPGEDAVAAVAGTIPGEDLAFSIPNPFKTIFRTSDEVEQNPSEVGYLLKGSFGLGNIGQGGLTSASKAKIEIEYGNNERKAVARSGYDTDPLAWKTGANIGIAGALQTRYEYADKNPGHLSQINTFESISLDTGFTALKKTDEGGSWNITGAFDTGYSWEQSAAAANGSYLPAWLAYTGYLAGIAGDLEKKAAAAYQYYGFKTLPIKYQDPDFMEPLAFAAGVKRIQDANYGRNPVNIANAIIGSTVAALGPATALYVETKGEGLEGAAFENTRGEEAFARLTIRRLWKSLFGLQGTVADQISLSFADIQGTWKDTFYANVGFAMPLGTAVPLLSYSKTWGSSHSTSSEATAPAETTSTSTGATSAGKGFYAAAQTGSQYPFTYSPSIGSNSYFVNTSAKYGSSSTPLGSGTDSAPLLLFSLAAYSGPINYPPSDDSANPDGPPITLASAGANLKQGTYSKVPLLGITLDGTTNSGAFASFQVENGSIIANTLQITTPPGQDGQYLFLPETEPGSGRYVLIPDVFSTSIAIPPDLDSPNLGYSYTDIPQITIYDSSTLPGSPLSWQPISRVQSAYVDPAKQQAGIYPKYDPISGEATAVPANNNAPYTYSDVAVQLISDDRAVSLLNPGQVTATVHLSGGVIRLVELDQPLLFFPQGSSSADQYSIVLSLPQAVVDALPANTITSFKAQAEEVAYNNLVDDDQFSPQAGRGNAGVYIAAGISDQIPLYASMGRWSVQNRVSYIADGQTVYLNAYTEESQSNSSSWVKHGSLTPVDLYPKGLNKNPNVFFSAASTPTSATIAGKIGKTPSPEETTTSYAGDTFVAWVEASKKVVPIKTGDGEKDFQNFMDAFYGNQRINYGINTKGGWVFPSITYTPEEPAVISHLKAFPVVNPTESDDVATLLVWTETSIAAIKGAVPEIGSGNSVKGVIKTGWINPSATSYEWTDLITDIQKIPWDPSTDVGLTIEDISISSLPALTADGSITELPMVSWSQDVRTPYRQSVLNDAPLLYLQFGELQSGYNAINIGSVKDPATTGTQASATGLNFNIEGALQKSQAAAVQNIDGTGVLSTGLGSMYGPIRNIVSNITPPTSGFTGSIRGSNLEVSIGTPGLNNGDLISGQGVKAGTRVEALELVDQASGLITYRLNNDQVVEAASLEALPASTSLPVSSFSGAINGTTLSVSAISQGQLQLGDLVEGQGIKPGTIITAINYLDLDQGTGSYTVSVPQTLPESALAAYPQTSTPYTIEFWARLQPNSNPTGAGLVAFGQPSSSAVGASTLPTGWLLSSSFVVDLVTYEQAAARGLIGAIPKGTDASGTYGWAWGVVADGANTTAMNGTGGSNLYSNALQINNLVSGASLAGMNQFLANYQLTSSDLTGVDQANAATVASVPITQLQFDNGLNSADQPVSILNNIAIDTSSALLNQGLMLASDLETNPNQENLTNMFEALWAYQQKTGEAKVNLSLAPGSSQITTTSSGELPKASTSEQYSGYELGFSLQNGVAVSVDGSGQLVFDFGNNNSIATSMPGGLRDDKWHYIAATYLPTYKTYTSGELISQVPTNVGTASLYVDDKLVASQSNVINAYAPINLNDQAILLANNAGGAIDQLAFYNKALTPSVFTPNLSGNWPTPSTVDALALLAAAGYDIDTKTPDPGTIQGALTSHWEARNVNPNDGLLGTYYSVYTPDTAGNGEAWSWSQATNLNPSQASQLTLPSASRSGSIQDDLVISVPVDSWTREDWLINGDSSPSIFGPVGQMLVSVTVTLTNATDSTDISTFTLKPDQVLLGSNSLLSLQPLAKSDNYQYNVPTSLPAFNFIIDRSELTLDQQYSASYQFAFEDPKEDLKGETKTTRLVTNSTPITFNLDGAAIGNGLTGGVINPSYSNQLETFGSAIATAQVIEQAPLQLKYIDSGEVFKSASSLASANSPATSTPANSFGQSQVYGSFSSGNSTNSAWLAIAQPLSTNASSNPAGRVWINFAGNFTINSGGDHQAVDTPALAPSTWLNALTQSNFSPDAPNLPLLGNSNYPSNTGGLLIQADPTVGWNCRLGQNMLVADVNQDGIQDLVIAAPQANEGGRVYIISGEWIQAQLTTADGGAILDLANPGSYVTVLKPTTVDSTRDDVAVAGFGSALAYDASTNTLWIGAPNYLRTLDLDKKAESTQPIGALYGYNSSNTSAWGTGEDLALDSPILGTGGTAITLNGANSSVTTYWGSQFGTAVATNTDGAIAISAPGFYAAMKYSGTKEVGDKVTTGKNKQSSSYGDGALIKIQLPDSSNQVSITDSSAFLDIINQDSKTYASEESAYMQNLKALQVDHIADATQFYNQALQVDSVGAVYYFSASRDLQSIDQSPLSRINAEAVAKAGGATFYGPNSWNVLGSSGFGSSLAFSDPSNVNSATTLAIGASQTGGSGAIYLIDTKQEFTAAKTSQPKWLQNINTFEPNSNQYLAHLVSATTLYGASSMDSFGNGLLNLGDVNDDGYDDLLVQAFNASNSAGNGYVLFGNEQLMPTTTSATPNPATGSVSPGSIGTFKRADGTLFTSPILSQLGNGISAYAGQGYFGAGDINSDGLNDIPFGSGPYGSSYVTWGHRYLESISSLQLDKLASNTGYMLDGLATTNPGSLRSVGDFNGDGYGDFISINPGSSLTTVRIELGGNTQEILADYAYEYYTFTVANGTEVLPGGDINGDGMDDIVLFLDQNLSSAADGNQGAGSSTGILYGRASNDLPLGSGFGFIAPVDPSRSEPLATLPGLSISSGLSDVTPAFISVGNTLYGVAKGYSNNTLWFAQSSDGGNSWSSWTDITDSQPGLTSNESPSLAYFNQKLYLSFVNSAGSLSLSSWDPTSNNPAAWSTPYQLSNSANPDALYSSSYSPQLVDRGDALGVVWVGPPALKPVTEWSPLAGAAVAMPALARLGNTIYMATMVEGIYGSTYKWTTSTDDGASWAEWQDIEGVYGNSPPSLAVMNGTLYASYTAYSDYNGDGTIFLSSFTPETSAWSAPTLVSTWEAAANVSIIAEVVGSEQQLAVYYTVNDEDSNLGQIRKNYSSTPADVSSWSLDTDVSISTQAASGPLAVTSYQGQTYIAYQKGTSSNPSNDIYVTTSSSAATTNDGNDWTAKLAANAGTSTGLGLASDGNNLILSYGDAASPAELQIMQITAQAGTWSLGYSYSEALPAGLSNNVAILSLQAASGPQLLLAGTTVAASANAVQTGIFENFANYPNLYAANSTSPDGANAATSWSSPTELLQRIDDNGAKTFLPINASSAPTTAWLGPIAVLAVNNSGTVNIYASSGDSLSWQLVSSFTAPAESPQIISDPELVTTDTGLALTYTTADGSITLHRLDLLRTNGDPLPGVTINANGSIDLTQADLRWQGVTLTADNSGISTSLGSVPLSVEGNLLLANVRNSISQNEQIWLNAIPNASDPDSTTWLNSTIQLADGSGGWSISQEKVLTSALAASWSDTGGQSQAAPVFAQDPTTGVIYAAVKGNSSGSTLIYWNYSTDGGSSWNAWEPVGGGSSTMTASAAPGLTVFNNAGSPTVMLTYLGSDNGIYYTTAPIISGNPSSLAWTSGTQIIGLAAETISLVTEDNGPALYYQGTNDQLFRAYYTPSTSSWGANAGDGINYDYSTEYPNLYQTSSGQLVATVLDGTTYLAYQGGTDGTYQSNTIYLTYSNTQSVNSSWTLIGNVPQPLSASHTGVGLTSFNGSLVLSYADQINSKPVVSLQQGVVSNGNWSGIPYALLESVGGTGTPLSSLFGPSGSAQVLVGSINTSSAYTANEILTTLTAAQPSPSTLSAVGDLNNDGYSDLLVTANNVQANTANGNQSYTGLRVITGAATSTALVNNNNSTSTSQTVQLAGAFSSGSQAPVSAITGSDTSGGKLTLGISARQGSTVTGFSKDVSPLALTTASRNVAEASNLLSGISLTDSSLSSSTGWGQQPLNNNASYGDLNADGYLDYLDPAGNLSISTVQGLSFSLWSIRAAGDVNGNGVDDVLLSLAPQGPAYQELTSGQPSALMSVLVDGSLFAVVNNQFSLGRAEGTPTTGWTAAGLKTPLNPYNSSQLYDAASTSTSNYVPSLQNWFDPILSFIPGSLTAASTANGFNPDTAESYTAPAVAISPEGESYLVFSGYDNKSSGSGLWMAYQQADGSWTQTNLPKGSDASFLSPSAVFYEGKLTIAYTDVNGDLNIAWCEGNPQDTSATWSSYQVVTGGTTDESSQWNPTLVVEAGRLALYFPSNAGNTQTQTIRYLYSIDPLNANANSNSNGNWGSSWSSTDNGYSGVSGTITIGTNQPTVTSPIAATTFQGRTVLAFRSSASNLDNGHILLLTQVGSAPTSSDPGTSLSWVQTDTGQTGSNGVGLTTDQALLYLTSTTFPSLNFSNPSPQIWSLAPGEGDDGTWTLGTQESVSGPGFAASFYAGYNPLSESSYGSGTGRYVIQLPTVLTPFMLNGKLMATWSGGYGSNVGKAFSVQLADLNATITDPSQQSLAGYSIDGNIDINGDGFMDVLISDPSDPSKSVNNQYALFGGDYLDIASQVGTPGNDSLTGTPLADVIYTIGGSDRVISNGGADVIYTGSGDDQISITDNAFTRIDAGSGFDTLLLQGFADQHYDFRLDVAKPEYFFGTKLRNVESINSINYGANVLSFDLAGINASNPDRVLFITPDIHDSIRLTLDYQRNVTYDTSYGGTRWSAYAAIADSSNPVLLYVRIPDGQTASWLSSNVSTDLIPTPSDQLGVSPMVERAVPSPIPVSTPLSGPEQSFGEGLSLKAYRVNPGDGFARFSVSRNDTSKSQLLAYSSTSLNASASLGPDAKAVAGLVRLPRGQATVDITVPADNPALLSLRSGSLSLKVQELIDLGQEERHFLFSTDPGPDGNVPVLSGFDFSVNSSATEGQVIFRADINSSNPAPNTLTFQVSQRESSIAQTSTISKSLSTLDAIDAHGNFVPAYNIDPRANLLDTDQSHNGQVSSLLKLDLMAKGDNPALSLSGPGLTWSSPASIKDGTTLQFEQNVELTAWRSDQGSGQVTFDLASSSRSISLLQNAKAGSSGAITPDSALDPNAAIGWLATEGLAVGSLKALSNLDLLGTDWKPTATRDGKQLALQNLEVDGNRISAEYENGVKLQLFIQAITSAPSPTPVRPEVLIQRLARYNNYLGFYEVDSITGEMEGIMPGATGYLNMALEQAQAANLLLDASELPGYGEQRTYSDLLLDPNKTYGVLLLQNGIKDKMFSSFAAANRGGASQMVTLGSDSTGMVLGIEDRDVLGGASDFDHNDLIVSIRGLNVAVF